MKFFYLSKSIAFLKKDYNSEIEKEKVP